MKKGTKLYLDNCCFNRPYDDQSSLPIRLETEAKLDIQEKIESNELSLGWSYILDFENNANPFVERKIEIQRWRELANSFALESEEILFEMDKVTIPRQSRGLSIVSRSKRHSGALTRPRQVTTA